MNILLNAFKTTFSLYTRHGLRAGALVVLMTTLGGGARADQFANPLDVRLADPQVLYDNGVYYMYATSNIAGFKVWTSSDLVNWRDRGAAYRRTASTWGRNRFWAPEVIKYGSTYYMFYGAGGAPNDVMRICVASSASPLGPFIDIAAPLWDDGKSYIDAHVFIDSDGQRYLFASQDMSMPADGNSHIVVAKLNASMTGLTTAITDCIVPSVSWEYAGNRWNEAPFVVKHGNYYYMLYSGNVYSSSNYAVGYATATSPMGPWTKYSGNPVLKKATGVSGPGHCSVVKSPDGTEDWIVYHTHQQASGGGERQLAIDRMRFVPPGSGPARLVVDGPTLTMQNAPSGTPSFPAGGSDEFNGNSLNRNRWLIFNEVSNQFNVTGGYLRITARDGDTHAASRADQENIFLQYPPYEDYEITTKVNFLPLQNYEQACLYVWQDHNNYIRFSNAWIGRRRWEMAVEKDAVFSSQQVNNSLGADAWFRIRKVGNTYTFWAAPTGTTWSQVGSAVNVNLIDRKVGLGATAGGSGRSVNALFDYFHVTPINTSVDDWAIY